jgi:hypothetical protein
MKHLDIDWTPEETELLKLIYFYRKEVIALKKQLGKRHSHNAVLNRAKLLGIQVQYFKRGRWLVAAK